MRSDALCLWHQPISPAQRLQIKAVWPHTPATNATHTVRWTDFTFIRLCRGGQNRKNGFNLLDH